MFHWSSSLASVPGRWSDNGMSLEPGQPVNVHFRPESEANLEFDVEMRSLGTQLNEGL